MHSPESNRDGARPVRIHQAGSVPSPLSGSPERLEVPPSESAKPGTRRKGKKLLANRKRQQKGIKILQWNAEGIHKKKLALQNRLYKEDIDIAVFQETHLTENLRFNIRGYEPFRLDRENHKGGVLILAKHCLSAVEISRNNSAGESQSISIEFNMGEEKWTIHNIYCPQDKTIAINKLEIPSENCLVIGDFNARSERWGYPDTNNRGMEIEEWEIDNNMILLNSFDDPPTFYSRRHRTSTTPDLAFATGNIAFKTVRKVCNQLSTSDHKPILLNIDVEDPLTETRQLTRWNYKKADWDMFSQLTDESCKNIHTRGNHIERMLKELTCGILESAKKSIPRGSRRNYKPYWTEELEKMEKRVQEARDTAETELTVEANIAFKKASAELKKATNTAARKSWKEKTESLNMDKDGSKLWKLVNVLNDEKVSWKTIGLKSETGEIITGKKAANKFMDTYSSVSKLDIGKEEASITQKRLMDRVKQLKDPEDYMEIPFTTQELEEAMSTLQKKKSPGKDEITNEMLLNLGPITKKKLLEIINSSWKHGKVPHGWKEAIMIPIHKKGKDPQQAQNYRPISLLSCVGKLMEKMVNTRLTWHLEQKQILIPEQAGFRKGRSTEDQVTHIVQEIEDGFQQTKHTLALWIDMEKAFDKVWRLGLKGKLLDAGVNGKMLKWLMSYLDDRTARVKMQGKTSRLSTLEQGVPQGGNLSPTLFLIYINDILKDIPKTVKGSLYADDVALWITSDSIKIAESCMQKALDALNRWAQTWKMKINEEKTTYTVFSLAYKLQAVTLNMQGKRLKQDNHPVYLGLTLDQRLTWAGQIEKSTLRAKLRMNMMRRISGSRWGADLSVLKKLYTARVRPVMEYGVTAWNTAANCHLKKINTVQNQAMRIMTGGIKSTPIDALETATELESMGQRKEFKVLQLGEKIKRMDSHPLHERYNGRGRGKLRSRGNFTANAKAYASGIEMLKETQPKPIEICRKSTPWTVKHNTKLIENIPGIDCKKEQLPTERRAITLGYLSDKYPEDQWTHVYTDGSAEDAVRNGGGGIYFKERNGSEVSIAIATGKLSTNYKAETEALKTALHQLSLSDAETVHRKVVILTDASSVIQAIRNPKRNDMDDIRSQLQTISSRFQEFTVQWIPSHCGIPGNERADTLAKNGSQKEQPDTRTSYEEIQTILKRERQNRWNRDHQERDTNDNIKRLNREGQVLIFRLRTGHCLLRGHLFEKFKIGESGRCLCDSGENMTPYHILQDCQMFRGLREQYWPQETPVRQKLYGSLEDLYGTVHCVKETGLRV